MIQYREIIRLHQLGINKTDIAKSMGCSRTTVRTVLKHAQDLGFSWPLPPEMTDESLQQKFFQTSQEQKGRRYPDVKHIHKELMRDGVNLKLLWSEYCTQCRQANELPLMYSQFCELYRRYAQTQRMTMHIPRKPGEILEVDWAGQTTTIFDRDSGEPITAYLFVGTLPYSQYAYVEAFLDTKQESWISAHVNLYQYVGGVTKILIPDNLKTGIIKPDLYDPQLNRTYREMSEHYQTAVIPARVKSPKDKPSVESTVGSVSTWILAAIRDCRCFSITELNRLIREKLEAFNNRPFQKREGSRRSVFLEEEKPLLLSLPSTPYELSTWKQVTVQYNYHIQVEKMYYSVPFEYIKHKVDVRMTRQVIEVFYKNERICSHQRLRGVRGQYATLEAHMPPAHKHYLDYDSDTLVEKARAIGPNTTRTSQVMLSKCKVEKQAHRSCIGLLRLAEKYSPQRLEAACDKALTYTSQPSLKVVKGILSASLDKPPQQKAEKNTTANEKGNSESSDKQLSDGAFTRGAAYYGRK